MRLLVITHRLPYAPNRGDRIRAFHMLRVLAKEHEVHLVSLTHDRDEASHVGSLQLGLASVRGAAVPRMRLMAGAVAALPTSRPLTHVLLNSPQLPAILRETVRTAQPEAVLAYCTGVAQCVFWEPLARLPFFLDMLDLDSEKWASLGKTQPPPLSWIYRREARVLRAFERKAVTHAVATAVVSERERELAQRVLDVTQPIVVAPSGVDFGAYKPTSPPADSQDVVFTGVFDYSPNEEGARWIAAAVWPEVKRTHPSAVLKLVGMNPSRAVRALAQPGSIEVTGAVPDVRPYLWNAAVAAAPLQLSRGMQNKVVEAVAAGIPCVVTKQVFEGLPIEVRPGVINTTSAGEFIAALRATLSTPPAQRRAMAAAVDASVFSWEEQLEPLLAQLRQPLVSRG